MSATQTLVLPTKRSEIDKRYASQKFGMIGPPGIGKSEFWSYCNGLFIQTENGLNHLEVMKIKCSSWEDANGIYSELLKLAGKSEPFPYDTIIIDTIDNFVDLANEEAVNRGREKYPKIDINAVGDIPNGAGWAWATDLIKNYLGKLEELPCATAYIGHLEVKEVKEPTRSIHKQTISIGGKMGAFLTAWVDHFLNVSGNYAGSELKRMVRTLPTATLDAKSRGGLIKDGWIWDKDSKKNWEGFRSIFE